MLLNKIVNKFNNKKYLILSLVYFLSLILFIIFSLNLFDLKIFINNKNRVSSLAEFSQLTVTRTYNFYSIGDKISYYSLIAGKEAIINSKVMEIGGNVYVTERLSDRDLVKDRLVIGKIITSMSLPLFLLLTFKILFYSFLILFSLLIIFIETSSVLLELKHKN